MRINSTFNQRYFWEIQNSCAVSISVIRKIIWQNEAHY